MKQIFLPPPFHTCGNRLREVICSDLPLVKEQARRRARIIQGFWASRQTQLLLPKEGGQKRNGPRESTKVSQWACSLNTWRISRWWCLVGNGIWVCSPRVYNMDLGDYV